MLLIELPTEILAALPSFLYNIEDFMNAASSCRTLRNAFTLAKPNTILQLAAVSAPVFFSPHPWFLVLATARQVSDWAAGNESRMQELRKAFQGGMEGLYDLCLRVGGLPMDKVRQLHLSRFSTINPLSNKIDQMAADQWYDVTNFWSGAVSEANTIHCVPQRSAFQIMIYWELFGGTLRAFLEPDLCLPKIDLLTRLEYIKYCIPDWICEDGYPGLEVLPVGPYLRPPGSEDVSLPADQIALNHILTCGRWRRLWQRPMLEVGPDLEDQWRQVLWENACLSFGLESMDIIKDVNVTSEVDQRYLASEIVQPDPVLTPMWHQRLSTLRQQIEHLDSAHQKPETRMIGERRPAPLSEAPNMAAEVHVCMAAYWPGVN
jgi:hypothetical protein